jgi:hypothetical protein
MRIRFLTTLLVIFICIPTPVLAQQISDQKKAVAFAFGTVRPRNPDGSPMTLPTSKPVEASLPIGTVFFVYYPDARMGADRGFGYLVTAKHVLKDADGRYFKEISVRVNLKEPGDHGNTEMIAGIPVSDGGQNLTWFHDPDEAVDVAAIPFSLDQNKYDYKTIPVEMFADETVLREFRVGEGDSVYFIGLMAQYYGESKNYPVVRRGTLALMTEEKIDTPTGRQNAYIAELVSWPGNSGSPVFLNLAGLREGSLALGSHFRFLGLLSGGFLNRVPGTILDAAQVVFGDGANIGISFVVPGGKLKAVLESAPAQAQRDAVVQLLSEPTGSLKRQ